MESFMSKNPFTLLSKIIGFAPFYYEVDVDKIKIKFKLIWILQFLLMKCVFPGLGMWFVLEQEKTKQVISELWRLIVIFGLIMDLIQSIIHISQTRRIAKLIQLVQIFDKKLQNLGCSVDYKIIQKKTLEVTILLIFTMIVAILVVFIVPPDLRSLKEITKYSFLLISVGFFSTQFYVFIWQMKIRFEKLNQHLIRCLAVKNGESQKICDLQEFFTLYHNLSKIVSHFNQLFTQNLTFNLLNVLANEILAFYSIIRFLRFPIATWQRLMSNIVWGLIFIICNILICYSGFSVRKIAESNGRSILKSMKVIKHVKVNNKIREIHNQMKVLEINIQNGIFVVDWKLFFIVSYC